MTTDKQVEDLLIAIMRAVFDISDSNALLVFRDVIEMKIIERRGYIDGRSAGTWVFDGNTQEEHFKRIQRGVEEGDPMYLDMLPQPRVGGEFADDPTWENILDDERIPIDGQNDPTGRQDLYDAYCAAFQSGVEDEVMAYGKYSEKS